MKNLYAVAFLFLIGINMKAQESDFPKNEAKLNIANTIAIASVEVGYERFIGFNQ